MTEELLTVKELSVKLRAHTSTVYRMLRNKSIPALRIGSDWRFDWNQVRMALEKLGAQGATARKYR